MRTLFADVCRGEVKGYTTDGEFEKTVDQRSMDTLFCLADRCVGQTDNIKSRQTASCVCLNAYFK